MLVIFHCPFCGGAAPKSKRELLFEVISRAEETRLVEILAPIDTIDDAISILGVPDQDSYCVSSSPEQDGRAPTVERYRELQYQQLSTIANVCIRERQDGKAYWQLHGKQRKR